MFAYWGLESSFERFLWSIERLGELGDRQYSLEILEQPHVAIYGPENITHLLKKSSEIGMRFSSFIPYYCCTNLTSNTQECRELGIKQFGEGVEIAKRLGISTITIASDWPPEWVSRYSPAYAHAPAEEFQVPSCKEYDKICAEHMRAVRDCVRLAEENQMRLGYELRANSLVSNVDSFLRMWDTLREHSSGN